MTRPSATCSAWMPIQLTSASTGSSRAAMDAPPNAAAVALTTVMPIWTVARNRSGRSLSRSAALAPLRPLSTSSCSRDLRRATTAISAPAKSPFARMSATMMRTSGRMARPPRLPCRTRPRYTPPARRQCRVFPGTGHRLLSPGRPGQQRSHDRATEQHDDDGERCQDRHLVQVGQQHLGADEDQHQPEADLEVAGTCRSSRRAGSRARAGRGWRRCSR